MSTIVNPPGQAALSYRATTYATSLASMLANLRTFAIPSGPNVGSRPLAALTTRAGDDPTIALLDAWAIVIDVLTFYQERIANEGYLRTATERISLIELAGEIGFQLDPGLAATAALAFVVDDSPSSTGTATIPVGTQVQSVPVQGQLPQIFEITTAISARAEWNALQLRRTQPQHFPRPGETLTTTSSLTFSGATLGLQQGAPLWVGGGLVHVGSATPDLVAGTTTVQLFQSATVTETVVIAAVPALPTATAPVQPGLQLPLTAAYVQKWILQYAWEAPDLALFLREVGWDEGAVADIVASLTAPVSGDSLTAFGLSVRFFGYDDNVDNVSPPIWQTSTPPPPNVFLERQVQGIVLGSTVVFVDTTQGSNLAVTSYTVTSVGDQTVQPLNPAPPTVIPPAGTTLATVTPALPPKIQVTGLGLALAGTPAYPQVGTIAYVQSRQVPLAPTVPLDPTLQVSGTTVLLDHMALGLMPGQLVAFTGQRSDTGVTQTEVLTLSTVQHAGGYTTLTFQAPGLANTYALGSVAINANVAPATHGQTVTNEVLGSGDGSQQTQTFTLAKPNLTFVPPVTARGGTDTLTVSVNGVAWQEVPTLFGQGGQTRCYMIHTDDQGKTSVIFGDGEAGARVPTGQENVTATYRNGLGVIGDVTAGSLMLLFNRPLGVRTVQNPLPASGGVDPEALADARTNAPLTVRTLGRIVTLSDYGDFATDFPGVGKAQATLLENVGNPIAHLTVAPDGGVMLTDPTSFLALIQSSITSIADPSQESIVDLGNTHYFGVTAFLVLQPGTVSATVIAAATSALETAFGFAARSFAQNVHAAEVVVALQGVPGVLGVELTPLTFIDGTGDGNVLVAQPARLDPTTPGKTLGADLVLISPSEIVLTSQP